MPGKAWGDVLNVVSQLGDAKQGTVDTGVLDALGVVSFVELSEGQERGELRPFQLPQTIDLLPQSLASLLEERLR